MASMKDLLAKATVGGGELPMALPPTFDSPSEERAYVKNRLAAAFRLFGHMGFDDGLAGHISVRDPERKDCFWVNPVGIHFTKMKVSDLVLLDEKGQLVEGRALVNIAAFAIHSRIHAARPDVNAVAHAHTRYGKAFSSLGQMLKPITQDSCVFFENHALHNDFSGVVEEKSEGDSIAEAMGDKPAVILQNHGLLTVGPSVDIAASLFLGMERACETQMLAQSAGTPTEIPADVARKTRAFNGSDLVLWGNFQPLYQMMVDLDPSFND